MSLLTRFFATLLLVICAVPQSFSQSVAELDAIKQAQDLYHQKKYKECLKLLKDTVKHDPSCSTCYVQLAAYENRFGNFPAAIEAADRAVSVAATTPLQGEAHLLRCALLADSTDKKQLATAEQDCRDVIKVVPKTAEAHLNLGLVLMRENRDDEGLAEVKAYVDGWPDGREVGYAKKVLTNPRAAREAVAPDFTITCDDGRKIASSDLAGKVIVIDFWATWCPACRAALPEMKELVKKYPSDKLVVISSSADRDQSAWRDYIAKKQMTWPQFLDKDDYLTRTFEIHAFPTYIVIDGDGFIRKRLVGTDPRQSLAYQLKAELRSVFESPAAH
jgi:thiol-disulfide isomerase/thioredoxin